MTSSYFAHPLFRGRSPLVAAGLFGSVLMLAAMLPVFAASSDSVVPALPGFLTRFDVPTLAPLVVAIALVAGVMAWGWPRLLAVPAERISRAVVVVYSAVVLVVGVTGQPSTVSALVAFAIPVAFISQMFRGGDHVKSLRQMSGTFVGILVASSAVMWLFVAREPGGAAIALVGLSVLCAGSVAQWLFSSRIRELAVAVTTTIVAVAVTLLLGSVSWWACAGYVVAYFLMTWSLGKSSRVTRTMIDDVAASSMVLVPHCAMGVVGYALALLFA
ncbi:hypothetical protein I6E29_02025 [Arcanobacterium haemolyticum]|nr:hypothetical protein [Arcanobacterium haemolyticum]